MQGKTHLVAGIAAAYMIMQPKNLTDIILTTVGGSIGGVMADLDVKIQTGSEIAKEKTMDALYGDILAAALSATLLTVDAITGGCILRSIAEHKIMALIGAGLFVVLCVLGVLSKPHRGRTHSLLALVLSSASVFLIHRTIGIAFALGYGTHLLLDLLNKSPMRLLYPLQTKLCLKLCSGSKLANEIVLTLCCCVIALYLSLLYGRA